MHALAAASTGSAGSAILGTLYIILYVLCIVAAYWAPTMVAWIRHVPNKGSVTVVNALLGWTVIGWIVALAMACRSRPAGQYVSDQWTGQVPSSSRQPGTGRS